FTNINVVSFSSAASSKIQNGFYNAGLLRHTGASTFLFSQISPGAFLRNLPGATYQFENDGSINVADCCSQTIFENDGLLRKIGGTNGSSINNVFLNNLGGTIDVESGQLTLANSGSSSHG